MVPKAEENSEDNLKDSKTPSKDDNSATLSQGKSAQKSLKSNSPKSDIKKKKLELLQDRKAINTKQASKEAVKRLPLVPSVATNDLDPAMSVKPEKTRKVRISEQEDVFELSDVLEEGGEEGMEGQVERGQGRQRPKGRVSAKTTVHVGKDSGKPECNTQ